MLWKSICILHYIKGLIAAYIGRNPFICSGKPSACHENVFEFHIILLSWVSYSNDFYKPSTCQENLFVFYIIPLSFVIHVTSTEPATCWPFVLKSLQHVMKMYLHFTSYHCPRVSMCFLQSRQLIKKIYIQSVLFTGFKSLSGLPGVKGLIAAYIGHNRSFSNSHPQRICNFRTLTSGLDSNTQTQYKLIQYSDS